MEEVKNICIVGTGFMGTQIGLQCAIHGYRVNCHDISPEALERGRETHKTLLGKMAPGEAEEVLGRISYTTDLERAGGDADIAIESVPEKLDLKREIFSELDRICPEHAIIATGASVIRVSLLEDATSRPDRVLNMHFYPPIWERPVVELMGGSKTSQKTMGIAMRFARSIGLTPLVVKKEISGFLFNRIWNAIKREALFLVDGGYASFEDIDRAWMINTEMKIGPFGLMDMVGLDVIYNVSMAYYREGGDERDRPPKILMDKVERGELGVKTGKGFYTYPNPAFQNPEWLKGEM